MPTRVPVSLSRGLWRAAALAVLALASPAGANEFYFVALFSAQRTPNDPDHSHTFAVFVRAYGDGPCPPTFCVEDSFCISWLPETMVVHTGALLPVPGNNFGLQETVEHALDEGERVSLWGPYQIDEKLYDKACAQYDLLESGRVRYKAIDSGYPVGWVSNCIHAVSASADGDCPRILSPGWGDMATWIVAQRFRRYIFDPHETQEWVCTYLGLGRYPIVRRDFDQNPETGAYHSAIKMLADVLP